VLQSVSGLALTRRHVRPGVDEALGGLGRPLTSGFMSPTRRNHGGFHRIGGSALRSHPLITVLSLSSKQSSDQSGRPDLNRRPLDPQYGVRRHPSSKRVFRAGVLFADMRLVQRVAWRVVPSWSPDRPSDPYSCIWPPPASEVSWPLPAVAKEDWDRLVTWDSADLPPCRSSRLLTAPRARNPAGRTIGEAAMP
jgi:hypothetical protein